MSEAEKGEAEGTDEGTDGHDPCAAMLVDGSSGKGRDKPHRDHGDGETGRDKGGRPSGFSRNPRADHGERIIKRAPIDHLRHPEGEKCAAKGGESDVCGHEVIVSWKRRAITREVCTIHGTVS